MNTTNFSRTPSANVYGVQSLTGAYGFGSLQSPSFRLAPKQIQQKKYKNITKKSDFFCQNEIYISNRIINIPNHDQYFSPVIKKSYLKIAELHDEDLFLDQEIQDHKQYMLLTYLDYGSNDSFYQYFYNKQNQLIPKKYLLTLIDTYKYLLSSLQLLHNQDIVYLNITPKNILFDLNNKPVLTNFDKSFHIQTLNEERKRNLFAKYDPANYFLPIEIHILCFLDQFGASRSVSGCEQKCSSNISISMMNIETVCNDYIQLGLNPLNIFSTEFIEHFKTSTIFSLQSFINKPKDEIITGIIQQYYASWDKYSLSMMYFSLLTGIFNNKNISKNKFVSGFSELLIQNIHINTRKTITIQKNASLFNEFMYSVGYEELIEMVSFFT